MIGGKNLRKFRPGRGLGKEGAGGLKRRSDHSQWKPEDGCQQESDNPPSLHPPALERYSCSSFGEWVGLAGHGGTWRTQRAKRDRPGGGCPSRGSKAVTCGLGFPVSSTRSTQDIQYPPALVPLRWGSEKSPTRAR